ncbi:hypothetical protein WJX72_009811 [[Myrmecia] bisecta]|uniref:Uncharacterized protein n=1 Tax=[Myrmecia] bisecta TaxID=41462 RepID=A0AAW1Q529_9CHLO
MAVRCRELAVLLLAAILCQARALQPASPAGVFRKLLAAAPPPSVSDTKNGAAAAKRFSGVWQGVTYSPAAIVVDGYENLLSISCVDAEFLAAFTGISKYISNNVLTTNETFTFDGTSLAVNLTGGQIVQLALDFVGDAFVAPLSLVYYQSNYTTINSKDSKKVLAVEIEQLEISVDSDGSPVFNNFCRADNISAATQSTCISASSTKTSPGIATQQAGTNAALARSADSGVEYDPVGYCSGEFDTQDASLCNLVNQVVDSANLQEPLTADAANATDYCFPASQVAITDELDFDLCCLIGMVIEGQGGVVDSQLKNQYCTRPTDTSRVVCETTSDSGTTSSTGSPSSPSPNTDTDNSLASILDSLLSPSAITSPSFPASPGTTSSPSTNSGLASSGCTSSSSSSGGLSCSCCPTNDLACYSARCLGGAGLSDILAAQHQTNLAIINNIGKRRRSLLAADATADNLGLKRPRSVTTRAEFTCISGDCLKLFS